MLRFDWLLADFFGKILDKVEFQNEIYFKNLKKYPRDQVKFLKI